MFTGEGRWVPWENRSVGISQNKIASTKSSNAMSLMMERRGNVHFVIVEEAFD
jgi:hypothetical protein